MVPALCRNRTADINLKVAIAVDTAHSVPAQSSIHDVVYRQWTFLPSCTQAAFDVWQFHCLLHLYYNDFCNDTPYPQIYVALLGKA